MRMPAARARTKGRMEIAHDDRALPSRAALGATGSFVPPGGRHATLGATGSFGALCAPQDDGVAEQRRHFFVHFSSSSMTSSPMRSRFSFELAPMCGVMITFGAVSNGHDGSGGSENQTSVA